MAVIIAALRRNASTHRKECPIDVEQLARDPAIGLDSDAVQQLRERLGDFHLYQRLNRERRSTRDPFRRRPLDEVLPVAATLKALLAVTGLGRRGRRNALALQVQHNTIASGVLPEAFSGFRILHLSDLHLRGADALTQALVSRIKALPAGEYDVCIFTGDYRAGHVDPPGFRAALEDIINAVAAPCYAVLGNHDGIAMVPWLEAAGVHVLLNESVTLHRDSDAIVLAGVDDYHWFRLANLEKALAGTDGEFTVLLNHSPEQYQQAAVAGVDVYLSGHTHGGQVCLPGGFAPKMNIECRRGVGSGRWQYLAMQGYTSRGIGTSLAPVRFNCPPEIIIHALQRR